MECFYCDDEDGKSNSSHQKRIDDTDDKEKKVMRIFPDPTIVKLLRNPGSPFDDKMDKIFLYRDDVRDRRVRTPDCTHRRSNSWTRNQRKSYTHRNGDLL